MRQSGVDDGKMMTAPRFAVVLSWSKRGEISQMSNPRTLRVRSTCLMSGQHDLKIKAERLRCADARGKRGGKHVRADGDICVVALVEVMVEAFKNRLKV